MMFHTKPVEIEARQLASDNLAEVAAWSGSSMMRTYLPRKGAGYVQSPCMEGEEPTHVQLWRSVDGVTVLMDAHPGDWIARGKDGQFTAWKQDAFVATFDPVEVPA